MLPKWKSILIHWIHCYSNNTKDDVVTVNLDSLLDIIAHLRENFSLDESKSSLLGAHTIEEFITEKYPHFKYENGSVVPTTENDFYLAASLLLYFVCVNSKQIDIKNAMCSKLSTEDQELILKFSKSLMESSPVSRRDVEAAITEACGHNVAIVNVPNSVVAETPPALRSLHSEVRRLQAALEAERFDRNYLQEELARTNVKFEKLSKDKEQYKLEILDLKAQISLCCGQEESVKNSEAKADLSAKLSKELQDTEERLVQTKEELDELTYERDVLKSKIEQIKQDRDKWFAFSQQESAQVSQLSEQLEIEKRNVSTLKDLVTELRQHNRLNRFDSSLLECDDPDASIHSLPHNSSICSEACANVVEVQLGEERAKIVELKQQIQTLQDQINDLTEKSEKEKLSHKAELSEKESESFNLKHRINEEIEKKDHLKMYYDDEMTRLNNEINELEQRLKDNGENSRNIIERKMQEIQTLQEEKLSLLQSLNDETSKLDNIIKALKNDLNNERHAKATMKENYESHIMKLNEKMLNRNNELVELQNNVCLQSETIERLHLDLRNEKERNEELSNKFDRERKHLGEQIAALVRDTDAKTNEITNIKMMLEQKINLIEGLNKQINKDKISLSEITEVNDVLKETKAKLMMEIKKRDAKFAEINKDIEKLKIVLSEEKDKLIFDLDEKNATINSLKNQLESEIHFKVELQNELMQLQNNKVELTDSINKMNNDIIELQKVINEKDITIEQVNEKLELANAKMNELQLDNNRLNEQLKNLTEEVEKKNNELKLLELEIEKSKTSFESELQSKDEILEGIKANLNVEVNTNKTLKTKLNDLMKQKENIEKQFLVKTVEVQELQIENNELSKIITHHEAAIATLEQKVEMENQRYNQLEIDLQSNISTMTAKLHEAEKVKLHIVSEHENSLQALENDCENFKKQIEDLTEKISHIEMEKQTLKEELNDVLSHKIKIEEECKEQCLSLEEINNKLKDKMEEISNLQHELQSATTKQNKMQADKDILNEQLLSGNQEVKILLSQKDIEIENLRQELLNTQKMNTESQHTLESKNLMIELLKKEKESLHRSVQETKNINEITLKEKDEFLIDLQQKLKDKENEHSSIKTKLDNHKASWEETKHEMINSVKSKELLINELQTKISELEEKVHNCEDQNNKLKNSVDKLTSEKEEVILKFEEQITTLREALHAEEVKYVELIEQKNLLESQLSEEKASKDALETEKKELSLEKCNISDGYNDLLNEKAILAQEVCEERSVRRIVEEEKNNLVIEKHAVENQLHSEIAIKNTLIEEKECLAQQLIEERLVRELTEREKENLIQEKITVEDNLAESEIKIKEIEQALHSLIQNQSTYKDEIAKEKLSNTDLKEQLDVITNDMESIQSKYNSVVTENERIVSDISQLNKNNEELVNQVDSLQKELAILKSNYDAIVLEKIELVSGNKNLMECEEESKSELVVVTRKLKLLESKYSELESEKDKLTCELEKLRNNEKHLHMELNAAKETLEEIKSKSEEFENEKQKLLSQIDQMQSNKCEINNKLERANQDLKEIESEYNILSNQKSKLISEVELLKSCEKELKDELQLTKESLEEAKSNYNVLVNEKENLFTQVYQLTTEVMDNKLINTTLINDKELLLSENESLAVELSNEKRFKDEIENEKKYLENKIVEINDSHSNELRKKIEELNNATKLVDQLKTESDDQLQLNNKILNEFNNSIKYIVETLKKNNKNNVVTQLMEINDIENITIEEKCSVLTNAVESLIKEVILKSEIEDALKQENSVLNETQEICKQKEIKIFELQTEVKRLEQVIAEYKTEFSKKTETYTTSLNSKTKNVFTLQQENQTLHNDLNDVKQQLEIKVHSLKERLTDNENLTDKLKKSYECQIDNLNVMVTKLTNYLKEKALELDALRKEKDQLQHTLEDVNKVTKSLENDVKSATINQEKLINDFESERQVLKNMVTVTESIMDDQKISLNNTITEHLKTIESLESENKIIKDTLEQEKCDLQIKLKENDDIVQLLMNDNLNIKKDLNDKIIELEKLTVAFNEIQNEIISKRNEFENLVIQNNLALEELDKHKNDIDQLKTQNNELMNQNELLVSELQKIDYLEKALAEQTKYNKHAEIILKEKMEYIDDIEEKLNMVTNELEVKDAVILDKDHIVDVLKKENEELIKVVEERNAYAVVNGDKSPMQYQEDHKKQVDNSSNFSQSLESIKTIADLEKIVHDKNRTITTLQSDMTYMKSLMAESETKLMDVSKELELSKENTQQLSSQLKKIVYQKNEEIAELKKQVNKMTIMENRASQIIKVSAKYQAIILRRIAEIKSNTVLKELTNFGNSNTCDNELRRNLTAGAVTMEDLENFLETTDKHLRKCSEKQVTLQKERDRLSEVNRINESEIISLKKYLTELSVTFQTFNSIKDMYAQKLSRVVSIQRTVRREILSLDGHINDTDMCKLERGYAAVIQDLAECAMNLQRWVERSVSRAVSTEKIKQAFSSDNERVSLAPTTFQNAGLEVQLEELENMFQKLLAEVGELRESGRGVTGRGVTGHGVTGRGVTGHGVTGRGVTGRGVTDEAYTVSELRAEYEDKLNRMKAKMKQLYQEQISIFKEKQREEISVFEKELEKARDSLAEKSRAYEDHIKTLTRELWSVGEKYLMERNEAEWLRRKQKSGSLMSLQHVHSSGLVPPQEEPSRPSDAHSLRSLPVNNSIHVKKDRNPHISEEGEVFDNRWLKELATTPRRNSQPPGLRLSELKWRNSLCPPHLKSSYPAETQFVPAFDEEDLKCAAAASVSGKQKEQRKEVGITAYKKPGPPTPSKQAGRLSATDSELRESLRVEADPRPARKTGTPSRFRSMFRSNKNDTNEGTPRRRLSNIFRMK